MAPLYRSVFTSIQERIYSGEWTEGGLMPTELELCGIFGVSRITVRRALDELSRIGLVERIQGKGTFVRKTWLRSGDTNEGFREAMRLRGVSVESRLLEENLVTVNRGVAETLRLKPGAGGESLAWYFRRLRTVDGTPMAIMNTFVPKDLGDRMRDFDLSKESFYDLYSRILGAPVARTNGVVSAVTPDAEACRLLAVPEGSAHLWYRSVGYLGDGRPVETCFSIFNASKYEFSMSDFRLEGVGRVTPSL